MDQCKKVIKKLERLEERRPDPSDHLVNIMRAVEGEEMNDEAWCNFYRYITCQNKDDWEFIPRAEVMTLGDLPPEYIESVQKTLKYPPEQTATVCKNGIEFLINVKNTDTIDKKHESVASASEKSIRCEQKQGVEL